MGPKDTKVSTEANGNVHLVEKVKEKAKISRTSSNASFGELTADAVDKGIIAVRQISKILCFVQSYHEEIHDVESIYGLGIHQQAEINELETTLTNLAFQKDQEMAKLRDENNEYRANVRQLRRDREQLERDQVSIKDTHKAVRLEVERAKEKEINKAKQQFSGDARATVKQVREELDRKIQALETDKGGLKDSIKRLEESNVQAQKNLNQQKKSLELEKRSFQSHIMRLESQLDQINAASTVSPQPPEFYVDSFRQLWEGIHDVAINDFRFLPEDTKPLDSDGVRDRLLSASAIFKYPSLSTESTVATFLRACAIQDFLSTKTISIVRRRYFTELTPIVERKPGTQPMDSILDTISNIPAANVSQDLAWRLMTVDRLDRLSAHGSSAPTNISTEPSQSDIIAEIMELLHYFQSPNNQQLRAKLMKIANIAIKLWSALRKDSCRIDFDYSPSAGDWQECAFVGDVATNGSMAASLPNEIPVAQLPSKPFMLFPRITGYFDPDFTSPHILHAGMALSHNSPVFRENLEEIQQIDYATKEFKLSLRRGSSLHSSSVLGKLQGE